MDVSIVIPESTRGDSCTPVIHFEFLDGQELLGDVAHAYITGAHAIQSPPIRHPCIHMPWSSKLNTFAYRSFAGMTCGG